MHCLAVRVSLIGCLMLSTAVLAAPAVAQDADKAAEMQKYMELATPGPHHKKMAQQAGTWNTVSKMWHEPGQPPMETKGTSTIESIMGGRFIEEVTTANMMGMPWEGRGTFGYNNATKKHVGVWYDTFGTMIMNFEGSCTGSCKVVTLTSNYMDPISNTKKTMKIVSTHKDNDHATVELFDVEGGKENKMGVIEYTRKGHVHR